MVNYYYYYLAYRFSFVKKKLQFCSTIKFQTKNTLFTFSEDGISKRELS